MWGMILSIGLIHKGFRRKHFFIKNWVLMVSISSME